MAWRHGVVSGIHAETERKPGCSIRLLQFGDREVRTRLRPGTACLMTNIG